MADGAVLSGFPSFPIHSTAPSEPAPYSPTICGASFSFSLQMFSRIAVGQQARTREATTNNDKVRVAVTAPGKGLSVSAEKILSAIFFENRRRTQSAGRDRPSSRLARAQARGRVP
jgi:hypothetical protein